MWRVMEGNHLQGSSVVSVQLSGMGLNGTMGYLLSNLVSLKTLDLSTNNIHDSIPYQLPPNLTSLNVAGNNISGNIPFSLSNMNSLNYLNSSRNILAQSVGDMFANHSALTTLDISFNNFTGDLPSSFTSLTNLSTLYNRNAFSNGLTAGAIVGIAIGCGVGAILLLLVLVLFCLRKGNKKGVAARLSTGSQTASIDNVSQTSGR